MADINKIIFTTKEAYEQKKSAGTLEEGVVYAIDAAQAVDKKEVKTIVDNGFNEFGFSLGINKDAAKFYNTPIALADMIKDTIVEKFNNQFTENYKRAGNGTKEIRVGVLSNENVFINAIQNGTDHGFVKFKVYGSDNWQAATVTIPDSVDITQEFALRISNLFGTSSCEITVYPTYEPIALELLESLINSINFDQPITNAEENLYYYTNTNKVNANSMMMTGHIYAVIPTNYDDISNLCGNAMKESDNSANVLFVNYTFDSYVDLPTGTWKQFPESVKDKVKKLSDKYTEIAKQKLGI